MATPISTTSTVSYDEILSTTSILSINDTEKLIQINNDLTNYLILIFPFYSIGILINFLSIYTILMAKIYRQYLSNVLLSVICIGSLINLHGQMFLILLRWTNNSSSNQLCSSSYYIRDCGFILIYTHILLLTFERIISNLKKHPNYLNNNFIQKIHYLLIIISLISIILSLTIPIFTLKNSLFSPFNGLCIPNKIISYKKYFYLLYYGLSHPFIWFSLILYFFYFFQRTIIIYSTLIPMNKILILIIISSLINLLIQTLFNDIIGIENERTINTENILSIKIFYIMNIRDFISIIHKILIGLVFFIFRPEIRLWLYESIENFRKNKNDPIALQMLDIRNEIEDNDDELNDDNLQFRADI